MGEPEAEGERASLRWRNTAPSLYALVLVTGALAGVAAAGLLALLHLLQHRLWPRGPTFTVCVATASPLHRVLALLLAGVLTTAVRLISRRRSSEPAGVLVWLWERAGIISLGRTIARSLLSIVDVSLGAALGREGALKELGGALASRVALTVELGLGQRRRLVACGTAAGLAAAYNVPLGGALFGLEVLLGRIEIEMVAPMILCCAVATHIRRWLWSSAPSYDLPAFQLGGPAVLARALVFGAVVGVISALVLKGLRWFSTLDERNRRLAPFMPLMALGALGILSAWRPEILGNGYEAVDAVLHRQLGVSLLVTLALLRFLATATCCAARVPGGLFTPMLSIGALLGGLVGEGVSHVWAGTSPGAFALLGMAALFAGASRGPIASVVIASELSDDYRLVLPLVFVCGAAAVVSRRLERGSLYRLGPRRQRSPRQAPPNPQIPLRPARTVAELVCGTDLMLALYASDPRPLFVVDGAGRLRGALHPETVRRRLAAESLPHLLVANDLADREHPRLSARASLEEATTLFESNRALRFVPVIDDLGMLLGEVSRESLL